MFSIHLFLATISFFLIFYFENTLKLFQCLEIMENLCIMLKTINLVISQSNFCIKLNVLTTITLPIDYIFRWFIFCVGLK